MHRHPLYVKLPCLGTGGGHRAGEWLGATETVNLVSSEKNHPGRKWLLTGRGSVVRFWSLGHGVGERALTPS